MSTLIVEYGTAGTVNQWRYVSDDDPELKDGELIADTSNVDHRDLNLGKYVVDTNAEPPELVENTDWEPQPDVGSVHERLENLEPQVEETNNRLQSVESEWDDFQNRGPVKRAEVSQPTKDRVRDNRTAAVDDTKTDGERIMAIQSQIDELFEVITGEEP